jgi:hypothetical protein
MLLMPHAIALWLLPRYVAGALPNSIGRLLRARLDDDVELQAAYHVLRRAERPQHGGLSVAQKELLLDAILNASAQPKANASPSRWTQLVPAGAAMACLAVFVAIGHDDDSNPWRPARDLNVLMDSGAERPNLVARGAANQPPLGVRVRCLKDGNVVDEASAGARQTGHDLDCGADGLLAFSTTNLNDAVRYAFVVGVDDNGRRVWLPPFERTGAALSLPAKSADALLQTLAPMPPQALTLFVLLDDEPFSADDVEARLATAARNGVPLASLDKLPLDVASQGRLLLRVK